MGRSLAKRLKSLGQWIAANTPKVLAAREAATRGSPPRASVEKCR
jgi:hypothetical protein